MKPKQIPADKAIDETELQVCVALSPGRPASENTSNENCVVAAKQGLMLRNDKGLRVLRTASRAID